MNTQSLRGAWQFRQVGSEEWLPASVPGGVHTDLLALGRIPDPFVGDNEKRVAWVAESDWEYRRAFKIPAELVKEDKVWLVCDGLDTLATVSLNGVELGRTDNMFRQYRWQIEQQLLSNPAGMHELRILFSSPVRYCREKDEREPLPGVPQALPGAPHLRKAPCQFGWDWGPQLPPVGVWRDIRLESKSAARLTDVWLSQRHEAGYVEINARVQADTWTEEELRVEVKVTGPDGTQSGEVSPLGDEGRAEVSHRILNPELWWPNGYGEQPLYRVQVTLQHLRGAIIDRREYQIGLRTIELRQAPDEWGRSFEFIVNGVRIFAKGSDWIPADSFPTRITRERLEWLIRSAAEAHQNMLRVWGGGFFEDEQFYDLCDQYGILVWQDFIFSCSIYPLDSLAFIENVREEVAENVRRLRHRACLALWCGNNEMEEGWTAWGWNKRELQPYKAAYDKFFHRILPEWIAELDPSRSYWPSSPSSNTPFLDPQGQKQGDAHYWEVWHGRKPFTAYRQTYPRFMSEFGFQALAPMDTIRTYAEPDEWNMTSYTMERHQKNASGNQLIIAQMSDMFRMPKDFESLVYLSMVLQAEGIRYGVEHWRRHMDRVAGTLYWQLNDCWPVASWSSLDYFGRWKALHYAARRFYAPLLLSIEERGTEMGVYLSSDLREPAEGRVRWSVETLDGEVVASEELAVRALPMCTTEVRRVDLAGQVDDDTQRECVFVAELWQGEERVATQIATFVPTKHLKLVDPKIRAEVSVAEEKLAVDLQAASLARLVEISFPGHDLVLSENYFDLPAGRMVRVTAPRPEGWTAEKARGKMRVRSVWDSF